MTEYSDIGDLDDGVLQCKHYRTHAWDKNPGVDISGIPTVRFATWVICSVCLRCGRERIVYLDRKGHRIGKPYLRNPKDYPKTHALLSDDIATELLKRSLLVQRYNGGK